MCSRKIFLCCMFILPLLALLSGGLVGSACGDELVVDIRDYGAKPDGKTLCTKAIQQAIDHAASRGGGTVYLPTGTWMSGTIKLKSNITLWLDNGSTLLGSDNLKDYPVYQPIIRSCADQFVNQSLILAEDVEKVAIRGQGCIDGNAKNLPKWDWKPYNRPFVIRMNKCRDVLVEGIHMQNSDMWMQLYQGCDRVTVRGITLFNHAKHNSDGINFDGCHDVTVSDCKLDADDDCICLKSMFHRACENVTVTNCIISTHCNAIKTGTHSLGGFKNLTISNCCILSPRFSKRLYGWERGLAAIALELVDGGDMDRVAISNISVQGMAVPIFIRLGAKGRDVDVDAPRRPVGTLRNVVCSNIVASEISPLGCAISGVPGHRIENVTLSNFDFSFEGGVEEMDPNIEVPEKEGNYPECHMFSKEKMYGGMKKGKVLPAYGLYCRHVKDLKLINMRLRTAKPDVRPAIICDDVLNLDIDGLDAQTSPGTQSIVRLINVEGAIVRGCQPSTPSDIFMELRGAGCGRIALIGNDLRNIKRPFVLGENVNQNAISAIGNLIQP